MITGLCLRAHTKAGQEKKKTATEDSEGKKENRFQRVSAIRRAQDMHWRKAPRSRAFDSAVAPTETWQESAPKQARCRFIKVALFYLAQRRFFPKTTTLLRSFFIKKAAPIDEETSNGHGIIGSKYKYASFSPRMPRGQHSFSSLVMIKV